jgi:acyl carrier protein
VPLPAYPWQRQRHWLAEANRNGRVAHAVDDADPATVAPPDPVADHTMYVRERVAAAAGLGIDEVPEDLPLEFLGLSSLSIVELRNQVERELGIVVPLAALLEGGTPIDLAGAIRETIVASGFVAAGPRQGSGG